MKDPYLAQIIGLLAAGMTATGLSISGYLHQSETFRFLGTQLTYEAAYRKIPLSLVGSGLCISAWLLTQTRKDYRRQYDQWERQRLMQQQHMAAIQAQSDLQGYQQLAQLQTAEKFYPQLAPYLDAEFEEVPAQQHQPAQQQTAPAPGQPAMPVTPTSDPTVDTTAYLQNFLEYPGLLFGGMGAGKSWTARYLVRQGVSSAMLNAVVKEAISVPKSAPPPLKLKAEEREQLQQLVNRHNTPQQLALRASIILLADEGRNHQAIAHELQISRDMARVWRKRWLALSQKDVAVVERLQDAERAGAPATFSLEQILQLFAMACEQPEQYGRPISEWTARELADELVKQGIVESISPRHVGRLLEEASLKPHQSGYWLNPPPTLLLTRRSKTFAKRTSRQSNAEPLGNAPSVSMR